MPLPRGVQVEHHSPPYEHLPVSLATDAGLVPPAAATDLWRRVQAHNRWLAEAYPSLVADEPVGYASRYSEMTVEDAADEVDPPDEVDEGEASDDGHFGGFGRP
jgi:hypothetical protein